MLRSLVWRVGCASAYSDLFFLVDDARFCLVLFCSIVKRVSFGDYLLPKSLTVKRAKEHGGVKFVSREVCIVMKRCCLFYFLFLLFNFASSASSSTLETLLKDLTRRNPDLAATRSRIKAAKIKVPRVQILDDPQFTFRTINHPMGRKREFEPQHRFKLTQEFPFPGKLGLRGEVAQRQLEFLESEEITTYRELVLQFKKLYFYLFFNNAAQHINQQNRDVVSRLIDGALAVYKTGNGKKSDVLKAQIEKQLLDDELLMLESEQTTLIAMLNAILDRSPATPIGELDLQFSSSTKFDYDPLATLALRERSELHGLHAMVQEQEANAKLAKRDYWPDFTFEFMIQNLPNKNKSAWGLNVGFNIPIWANYRQRREVQEAEALAIANQQTLNGKRAQICSRIKELLAKIDSADERIALYRTSLIPKIGEVLASNESNYLVGSEDFLTVLDTRRQFQDTELAYERARIEREILLADLEHAVGVPLKTMLYTASSDVTCKSKKRVHLSSRASALAGSEARRGKRHTCHFYKKSGKRKSLGGGE